MRTKRRLSVSTWYRGKRWTPAERERYHRHREKLAARFHDEASGLKVSAAAKDLGISESHLYNVLAGRLTSRVALPKLEAWAKRNGRKLLAVVVAHAGGWIAV